MYSARKTSAVVLSFALVFLSGWLIEAYGPNEVDERVATGARPGSPCRVPIQTTITATGRICDPIDVVVELPIDCPGEMPLHLVIVIERSEQMREKLGQAKQAAVRAIDVLDFGKDSMVSVCVTWRFSQSRVVLEGTT